MIRLKSVNIKTELYGLLRSNPQITDEVIKAYFNKNGWFSPSQKEIGGARMDLSQEAQKLAAQLQLPQQPTPPSVLEAQPLTQIPVVQAPQPQPVASQQPIRRGRPPMTEQQKAEAKARREEERRQTEAHFNSLPRPSVAPMQAQPQINGFSLIPGSVKALLTVEMRTALGAIRQALAQSGGAMMQIGSDGAVITVKKPDGSTDTIIIPL